MKTTKIPVPKKFRSAIGATGALAEDNTTEVVEFAFRSQRHPNGYYVTMAAIYLPTIDRLVFGASACSPEDSPSRVEAANRSIGRARQQAFWILAGFKSRKSLIGPKGCSELHYNMDSPSNAFNGHNTLHVLADRFAKAVAANAELESLRLSLRKLAKKHPHFNIAGWAKEFGHSGQAVPTSEPASYGQ